MTRQDILDALTAERYAPPPRSPRMTPREPPAPITAEEAEEHRRVLAEAVGGHLYVVERSAS